MKLTLKQTLRSINAYPIPMEVILTLSLEQGMDPDQEADAETLRSSSYRKLKARVLLWLSKAPDVSQGGQNYSFSSDQRRAMQAEATSLLIEEGEDLPAGEVSYGYKGDLL